MTISKKRLIPLLIDNGFIESDKVVSYEAFGKKVFAFIYLKDMETRSRLERFLKDRKLNPDTRYSPGHPIVEVPVSYFKAWHWDE